MPAPQSSQVIDYLFVYTHGVDDKRRVQIPAKWRPGDDQPDFKLRVLLWKTAAQKAPCLLAMPPEVWDRLRQSIAAMAFSDAKANMLRAYVAENSDVVTLDSVGRICLPQKLAEAAGIGKQAVLRGMVDRFQIWSPENFAMEQPISPECAELVLSGV